MEIEEIVAKNLRTVMAEKNISGVELSRYTGLSESTIHYIKNGNISGIRFNTLQKISECFEVPVDYFFQP
ncbi:helix-turn-helix domain-containing protein [Tetragenococcus halophilus]|uniref:helix-turn-helix domain-containing protein n=1 Tax=Tetragenococcus halophilus TaxID=51669 RepID=UPI00209ADCE3|nr:helix-turn-helix transcriptional regulator [Tetragenococcus halophilus]MCO8296468.1 helix-turn-helix transcriptional regulator [Tetragenococcus halophilus]